LKQASVHKKINEKATMPQNCGLETFGLLFYQAIPGIRYPRIRVFGKFCLSFGHFRLEFWEKLSFAPLEFCIKCRKKKPG